MNMMRNKGNFKIKLLVGYLHEEIQDEVVNITLCEFTGGMVIHFPEK